MPRYLVCNVQPDGTAAVTTPVPLAGESDAEAAARVSASIPGSEWVSAALVEALRLGDTPDPGPVLTRADFRKRLAPAYIAVADLSAAVQKKWDRIIGPGGLLADFTTIHLTDPTVRVLVYSAVADGLLTADQAAAVLDA